VGSIYYGTGSSNGNSGSKNGVFQTSLLGLKGGGCFVFNRFIKASMFTNMTYIQSKIIDHSNSNPQSFFVEYVPPKIYTNPAFTLGFSADIYIDFSPFYI
jgi:hypothetical protein